MAESDFVMAVGPNKKKRLVPKHYLDNPKFDYKLPPSARAKEPATPATTIVHEPAEPENKKEVRG
jgi:hypothetical protein